MTYKIKEIYTGLEEQLQKKNKTYKTSYKKQPINGSQYVNFQGLEEDNQSDKEVHGGVQRALCVFTQGSYDFFKEKHNINLPTCALGENITLLDCDDKDICLGDRFSCGEAVFEVSQPRQPCWIISSILGIKKLTALIVKEGRSGFYLRVIKEGKICKEDEFKLQIRKHENLNIEYINKCYYNAKENQEQIKEILEVPELSPFYRDDLLKRYKNKEFGLESFQKDKE
ncbi:MOSC domain-containing protein [Poseidonibacter lekithochrous]|uniref:MOSC domain-containing protein n=1 Tax=Poseidonibacter lekithochrous TaxID=1904463 RepID=UPI0008FC53AA|nr:MOSC domain-containing protein [Poseidonibacter lekithochrous]QKJ24403.1 MOSC domain-containing protein [Poseidonibacter lekithochrous]